MTIQRFIEELQRRHVFRVTGAYLVAAWVVVQLAQVVTEAFEANPFYVQAVIYAAVIGVPFMLVLSWMFDFTKDGIVRTLSWDETRTQGTLPGTPIEATLIHNPDQHTAVSVRGEDAVAYNAVGYQPAKPQVVLSTRATGMFGLGALVAIVSLAAYSRVNHLGPSATAVNTAADSTALVNIRAIAVMPFEDMSQKHDQQYFADGMTEELLNRLAQVENLQVVSGEGYASPSRGGDIRSVAEKMNVQAVLQGSVRKSQDSIRVTVKLINPITNALLYSESFTRPTSNVFQVQDEIAAAVAGSLQLQVHTGLAQAEGTRGTTNEDAAVLYHQGMKKLDDRTDESLQRAVLLFRDAIKRDPNFALAYAGLAQTYAVLPTVGSFPLEKAGREGSLAASQAISLDPSLGQAHAAIGQIAQNIGWDPASAETSYKRALMFMPSYATAHQWYAETLMMLGRTNEALDEITTAVKLEPYSPAAKNALGYILTIRGDLDSALIVFRNENALFPEYRLGHLTHALTALTAKQFDEAEVAAKAYAGTDTKLASALTAVVRGAAGTAPRPAALKAAASLEAKMGSGFTALWFAALGDDATAMKLVKKTADAATDANFPYFVVHPLLKPLHGRPEYQMVVDQMGVVPAK